MKQVEFSGLNSGPSFRQVALSLTNSRLSTVSDLLSRDSLQPAFSICPCKADLFDHFCAWLLSLSITDRKSVV